MLCVSEHLCSYGALRSLALKLFENLEWQVCPVVVPWKFPFGISGMRILPLASGSEGSACLHQLTAMSRNIALQGISWVTESGPLLPGATTSDNPFHKSVKLPLKSAMLCVKHILQFHNSLPTKRLDIQLPRYPSGLWEAHWSAWTSIFSRL